MNKPRIFCVPYEGGAYWRKGSKDGPKEIKKCLENIRPVSNYTDHKLKWPINTLFSEDIEIDPYRNELALENIYNKVIGILKSKDVPIALGGDHSITIPILRALSEIYGNDGYSVIHIDAHSDTFPPINNYRYHHGAVFRVAVEEGYLLPKNITQFGIRGAIRENGNIFVKQNNIRCISIDEWSKKEFSISRFVPSEKKKYYLSFDIDVVDPAFAPGTGTPVPGGLTSREAITIMRELKSFCIVGADFVEVAPIYDVSNITSLLTAYLVFELLANADFYCDEQGS